MDDAEQVAPVEDQRDAGARAIDALRGQLGRLEGLLHLPGRAMNEVESRVVPAWRRRTEGESRWAASAAILAVVGFQLTLPNSLAFPPRWLLPVVGGALLIGLLIADPRLDGRRERGLHATSIVLTGLMSLANAVSAARLIDMLLESDVSPEAGLLLRWGGAVWAANVVVFAMWYWDLDRGGPAARSAGEREYPDLLFPQMASPDTAPPDWEPRFLDYLYTSFTTSTAFSPTDVLPLARWAKMTMLLQTLVSITTVVLVVARAVNILGA